MKISAIVLAAGSSSRLGRAKQLLIFKGKSLIQNCIENLFEIGIKKPIIVLGARFEKINAHLNQHFPEIHICKNPVWEKGMAGSLQTGLSALAAEYDAVLICLSDQPLIPSSHFTSMMDAFQQSHKMIVSSYNEDVGVPAIIPKKYFEEIMNLSGKKGAKYLLRKYKEEALSITCPEAAYDVDTEEDYRRIVERN